jgi:hypothetical protein
MNDHLRAYRGYGPVAYVANLLLLASLPIANRNENALTYPLLWTQGDSNP